MTERLFRENDKGQFERVPTEQTSDLREQIANLYAERHGFGSIDAVRPPDLVDIIYGDADAIVAVVSPEIERLRAAEALNAAADAWQQGEWANAPRRADRVQERIANAQYVTDWLRARAVLAAGEKK